MATQNITYRPIDINLLNQQSFSQFDLYFRTISYKKTNYIKFKKDDPNDLEKVNRLLETGELEESLYIQKTDSFKYFERASQVLQEYIEKEEVDNKQKLNRIYHFSEECLKEFFEYTAPPSFLKMADQAIDLVHKCYENSPLGFGRISEIIKKDYSTHSHCVNVGLYCFVFGLKIKMETSELFELGKGGLLHDVGKSKIPFEVVNKPSALTEDELKEVQKHAQYGGEILDGMSCYGQKVIEMATCHHEKFHGGGYPKGLEGEKIPYFARICKVMDAYDALTSRRSYKQPMHPIQALKLMKSTMIKEFDEKIVDQFVKFLGEEN